MIYMGTGNAAPDVWGASRGGDNLFTASVLALDLKTGAYKWHFQEVHHDIWDHDASSCRRSLVDISIGAGRARSSMHPAKTGWLYILDRTNGKPLIGIEEQPVPQEPRMKTAKTQPFPIGDRFVPMCPEQLLEGFERGCLFSAVLGQADHHLPGKLGRQRLGADSRTVRKRSSCTCPRTSSRPRSARSSRCGTSRRSGWSPSVTRWDSIGPLDCSARERSRRWIRRRTRSCGRRGRSFRWAGAAGCLSTAGGLLFHGESDGNLVAYDINNGEELWKFQTGAGANAPVSTYSVNGEQYVAVMAGGNALYMSQRGDLLVGVQAWRDRSAGAGSARAAAHSACSGRRSSACAAEAMIAPATARHGFRSGGTMTRMRMFMMGIVVASVVVIGLLYAQTANARAVVLTAQDYTAITELYARLYQGSDLRELDVWLSNFADDGVFVFPDGKEVAGKKALGEFRVKSFGGNTGDSKRRHWVSGLMLTPMPDGVAKARAYWLMVDGSGKQPVLAQSGTFDDLFVKTKDGWKFKKHVVRMDPGL